MLQRYCAQCKNESSRTTSVKCVYFQTFLQISWGIVWGIVYFKFYPRGFSFSIFDYQYFKLFTIFNGKYKLLEPQKCPHNPEVVGSSPASATTKTPDFDKKSGVFLTCKNGAIKNAVGDSRGDSSEKCFFRKPGISNFLPVFCFPHISFFI